MSFRISDTDRLRRYHDYYNRMRGFSTSSEDSSDTESSKNQNRVISSNSIAISRKLRRKNWTKTSLNGENLTDCERLWLYDKYGYLQVLDTESEDSSMSESSDTDSDDTGDSEDGENSTIVDRRKGSISSEGQDIEENMPKKNSTSKSFDDRPSTILGEQDTEDDVFEHIDCDFEENGSPSNNQYTGSATVSRLALGLFGHLMVVGHSNSPQNTQPNRVRSLSVTFPLLNPVQETAARDVGRMLRRLSDEFTTQMVNRGQRRRTISLPVDCTPFEPRRDPSPPVQLK